MPVMVATSQIADGAITCGRVALNMAPCTGYLRGTGPVRPSCCDGIKSLNNAAKSTPDRRATCRCLKSLLVRMPGVNYEVAGDLPGNCGVNVGFPISASVNCDAVK
ncbi:Non-specific lipid-transfer protein 1 [Linum grandiflorum]